MRTAHFAWKDDNDHQHTYSLAYPLLRVRPVIRRQTWSHEALSGAISTVKSPTAVNEIEADIRFAGRGPELLELLSDRIGRPLTYSEERARVRYVFPSILVSISPGGRDEVGIDPDPQRFSHGEYSARIRLRRLDGGRYEALLTPLTAAHIVPDSDGGHTFSRDSDGALVLVDDGAGGYELAESGPPAPVMLAFPSDGGVSFYGVLP